MISVKKIWFLKNLKSSIFSVFAQMAIWTTILFVASTEVYALTPIAHTDVVPYQRIQYGSSFDFGVVAFSKPGINRVDFAITGQGYTGDSYS